MTWPVTFPAGLKDVSILDVVQGDTIMIILHSSYPALPEEYRDKTHGSTKTRWHINDRKPRKVPAYGTTMFGGTVVSNDLTTGTLVVNGSPNSLEGVHMHLKPGAGSRGYSNAGSWSGGVGDLSMFWGFIQQAFLIVDNPDHPGERPTPMNKAYWPKFFRRVRLDR